MEQHHLQVGGFFPHLSAQSRYYLTDMPETCILGDSRVHQADNQYWLSQKEMHILSLRKRMLYEDAAEEGIEKQLSDTYPTQPVSLDSTLI